MLAYVIWCLFINVDIGVLQTGISLQFSFSGQSIPNRENIKVSTLLGAHTYLLLTQMRSCKFIFDFCPFSIVLWLLWKYVVGGEGSQDLLWCNWNWGPRAVKQDSYWEGVSWARCGVGKVQTRCCGATGEWLNRVCLWKRLTFFFDRCLANGDAIM